MESLPFDEARLGPRHRRLYRYWRDMAPAGRLPGRQHFDPLDIATIMPWVVMYDVERGGDRRRFRFRLVGTEIVRRYARDMTGRYFEDAYQGDTLGRQLAAFSAVVDTAQPLLSHQVLPVEGRDHIEYERLILPMARNGEAVDMLIALMEFFGDGARADWISI